MAYKVVPDRQGVINIGKIKENLVTEVELPAPGFGGGSYAVLLRRPKEDTAYPVSSRHEGNALIWTVQTADTAIPGTGKLECRWYGDKGEVAKSQTYMVRITDGLPDPTEAPEAWEGFIGQVAQNAQAAQTAAGEAKASADGAAASAGIAQGAAADAGKLARAAGEAANAAAAAASAASSAQAGAETAGQNARAAAEAAETARSGAEAAKLAAGESATAAAESAEAAAQAAEKGQALYDQVKDDLAAGKLKGEKGDPGKDAPQIDDNTVSADSPWSSRKIVETLCPPIAESGNPVVCYPVAGYPLGVVASWEPTQAGTGAPSPENIRPISGCTEISVERCGENLLKIAPFATAINKGVTFEYVPDGGVRIHGTASGNVDSPTFPIRHLPPGKYYGLDMGTGISARIVVQRAGKNLWLNAKGTFEIVKGDIVKYWYVIVNTVDTVNKTIYPYIVPGTTAPTTYAPYRGDTLNLALPRTVYGGEVDAVLGEGQETWKLISLDGTENWDKYGSVSEKATASCFYFTVDDKDIGYGTSVCNKFVNTKNSDPFRSEAMKKFTYTDHPNIKNIYMDYGDDQTVSLDEWKSYLAAQYAAGTPVQIAYKLAEPVPFQATGNGPIMPLEGEANTVMTDADSVTVAGRADPIRIIQQMQAAQSVATQQLAETQQEVVDTTAMTVDYIYEQDSKIFGGDDDDNETDTAATDVP